MCHVVLTTLVSCRQPQGAQSNAQQHHITAAKSCDDKYHFLQHFSNYVLVVPGMFGQRTVAVGAVPCLHQLSANPTEDPWPCGEHTDVWMTARTLLCVLATGQQQSSDVAELSGSILHMLLGLLVMFAIFDMQGLDGVSLVCIVQHHSGSLHVKIVPSSVGPIFPYGL